MSVSLTAVDASDAKSVATFNPLAKHLGRGGAGTVFRNEADPRSVLKLYNDALDSKFRIVSTVPLSVREHWKRIAAMLQNVPSMEFAHHQQSNSMQWSKRPLPAVQIAWPQQALLDKSGSFVGFSMQFADFATTEPLESFFDVASRKEIAKRFALADQSALDYTYRLGVCRNLARLVGAVHEAGHAVGDLNPQNVRIYVERGLACLIDCDGFRIKSANEVFPCPKMLDEIAAPEIFQSPAGFDPKLADERQDLFALGLIVFRMLNDGKTPFHVVARRGDFQVPGSVPERIKAGLHGYGLKPHPDVAPAPGSLHELWPMELRRFFDRCFEPGSHSRLRPSAQEWQQLLDRLTSDARDCSRHGRGTKINGTQCVYCETARSQPKKPKAAAHLGASFHGTVIGLSAAQRAWTLARNAARKNFVVIALIGIAIVSLHISSRPNPPKQPVPRTPPWNMPPPNAPPVTRPYDPLPLPAPPTTVTVPVPNNPFNPSGVAVDGAPSAIPPSNTPPAFDLPDRGSFELPPLILDIQQRQQALKVFRGTANGVLDDATRISLASLGIPVRSDAGVNELQEISSKLAVMQVRQAKNMANAQKYLLSNRFPPAVFASLSDEDLLAVHSGVSHALVNLRLGDRYVHNTSSGYEAARIEVLIRRSDPADGCRKFDMSIGKVGLVWVVKGIRACGSVDRWSLER